MNQLDLFSLEGRVALVAGGGGAIGSAMAAAFAGAGAGAAIVDVTEERAEAAAGPIRAAGAEVASGPHVIFAHADDTLGPTGTDEWQAFVRDSEGNLVGLVEQRPR